MSVRETSKLAYHHDALPTLGARQQMVYDELHKAPNLTNSEIAGRLNIPINVITPRVKELRELGIVFEDGKRQCRVTGRTCFAWRVNRDTLF